MCQTPTWLPTNVPLEQAELKTLRDAAFQFVTLPPKFQDEYLYSVTSAVLDALALSGETQPYSKVAPIMGYHHRSRVFFVQLGRSLREDHAAGKPLRASLVINKALGMPGKAYFEVCRELGYDIPPGKEVDFWADRVLELQPQP